MNRRERTTRLAKAATHESRSSTKPPPAKEFTAVEHLHVTIQLKPQEKPVAFPSNFTDTLKDEYAVKYLQRLGAHPTPENIATVLKHLPLDDCQITSAWKVRGSLADVVMVDLHSKSQTGLRSPKNETGSGVTNKSDHLSCIRGGHPIESLATAKPYQVGCVCMSFDDMKHRYLLPFKHGSRQEADILTMFAMKHEEPATFVHIPAFSELHTKPTFQLFGRQATQRRHKCIEERAKPPEMRANFTKHILRAFFAALPFASLGIRSDEEKQKVLQLLDRHDVVELIEACVRYLYLEVFVKLSCRGAVDLIKSSTIQTCHSDAHAPGEIEKLYVAIVQLFRSIKRRMDQDEKGVALYLPLHLLALRVAVETVFRCQYPVSFSSTAPTMQYILVEMNEQITKILDCDQLLSRIGILETTCESSKVMASHLYQAKKRRSRLRDQYFQTSEPVHTMFPNPHSGKSRMMIKFRGGAAIGNYPQPAAPSPDSEPNLDLFAVIPSNNSPRDGEVSPLGGSSSSAFAQVSRPATLPRASLQTRLELLHSMERTMRSPGARTAR